MQADIKELATLLQLSEQIKDFMDGGEIRKNWERFNFPDLVTEVIKESVEKIIKEHYQNMLTERLDEAFEILQGDGLEQAMAKVIAGVLTDGIKNKLDNNDGYY